VDNKKILLVEDNPDDADLAQRALRKGQILNEVIVMHDGVETLDYLLGNGAYAGGAARQLPSFILLDLKLPKMDGLEVLRQLRAHPRTQLIPVVILTSSREPQDVLRAYRLGANSYICKPVNFNHYAEAVRQVGHYWLTLNECLPSDDRP
jgi:CheY-like chemotaxis protein